MIETHKNRTMLVAAVAAMATRNTNSNAPAAIYI